VNANRRIQHRAALAEAERLRNAEVQRAEREATQHTLREVGRELHDNVAQLLTVAQMGLGNVLEEPAPDGRLLAARDALDQGIEEVRRLGHDLNSDRWQQRSLRDAIGTAAERIERVGRVQGPGGAAGRCTGTRCRYAHHPLPRVPGGGEQRPQAQRRRHAHHHPARHRGTGPHHRRQRARLRSRTHRQRRRVVGIRKRCALVGYTAHCTSTPGQGCTWTLEPETNDHGT
jgi:hypothetical protein